MKKILFFLPVLLLLAGACKNKKTSMKDDDKVEIGDFIEFFPEAPLPFRMDDTTLLKKSTDSSQVGLKIFKQFIPDSILSKEFSSLTNLHLYSLARAQEKDKEKYLFMKAVAGNKRVCYLICFSNDNKYLRAMPIVRTGFDNSTSAYGILDKKFQITTYRERKQGNDFSFKRNVYFYNNTSNEFTLIMTEPNEEIIENVINPIDTFSIKHKLAGDYVLNKKNFISFRDSKRPNELSFFVHFEKNDGTCKGELKGVAKLVKPNLAVYNEGGNPCELQFTFDRNTVTMKETGGCGSYREVKCFFEGSFTRKKAAKPAETAPKKK
ncbi:hypothetical protein HHL16_09155 [Pseudoflavitalea sp. G-6-1-2]|uniref:hypothetical protein n=1 Tax=Pseudoflavitalea sp. G-6-1-2 TaxID=2728841 RepID=UPI00146CF3F2|nr:hypothetical protein [Pseudoflavitalea sp. G-6-1-2]NML21039.1 hypothetical protein [Pseudoflavitalea sp. G-6-1-2]